MQYENPKIPEDINVSRRNHLFDFSTLVIGAVLLIVAIVVSSSWLAGWLARQVPFERELALDWPIEDDWHRTDHRFRQYMLDLTDALSGCVLLPSEMRIRLHYRHSDTVNAFATLGGHVMVFQGLLSQVRNENELATILAHELAHIKHRDPMVALGRGVVVGMALSALFGTQYNPLSESGWLTVLKFNRDMETRADEAALAALQRCYGHTGGAAGVFELFEQLHNSDGDVAPPELFSTHPMTRDRIEHIHTHSQTQGWASNGPLTPLPDGMREWLSLQETP